MKSFVAFFIRPLKTHIELIPGAKNTSSIKRRISSTYHVEVHIYIGLVLTNERVYVRHVIFFHRRMGFGQRGKATEKIFYSLKVLKNGILFSYGIASTTGKN